MAMIDCSLTIKDKNIVITFSWKGFYVKTIKGNKGNEEKFFTVFKAAVFFINIS